MKLLEFCRINGKIFKPNETQKLLMHNLEKEKLKIIVLKMRRLPDSLTIRYLHKLLKER